MIIDQQQFQTIANDSMRLIQETVAANIDAKDIVAELTNHLRAADSALDRVAVAAGEFNDSVETILMINHHLEKLIAASEDSYHD